MIRVLLNGRDFCKLKRTRTEAKLWAEKNGYVFIGFRNAGAQLLMLLSHN